MVKQYASLEHVDHTHTITKEKDHQFLHQLQTGLLLALKEQGKLNEVQYQYAQRRLDQQIQAQVKRFKKKEEVP